VKNNATDLSLVIELAQRKRDQALQALGRAQQQQQQALLQMSQLQGYSAETLLRWSERARNGVGMALLHTHQSFMWRLEHALEFQQNTLEQQAAEVQRRLQLLLQAERELASLHKYQQRRRQVRLLQQQRQEQKANDEMAAVQHRQHAGHNPHTP